MNGVAFTARDLSDIADAFETFASDQLACQRFQSTAKAKRECEVRASVWKDAADILRETSLTGGAE